MKHLSDSVLAYFISKQKLAFRIELSTLLLKTEKKSRLEIFERKISDLFNFKLSSDIFFKLYDELEEYKLKNVKHISFFSKFYPNELISIEDFPPILFFKGHIELLTHKKKISIVGSRKADYEGKKIAFEIANTLANLNVVIVSGLAYGIDSMAHKGAISNKKHCSTIAVLGNGLPSIYPKLNQKLSEEIIEKEGLIISQFPTNMRPLPHNFLNRNRTIASLSELILVVQAEGKSGSLVTAKYANEFGKVVGAIPGAISNKLHKGCNEIIKNGAYLIAGINDLTDLLNLEIENSPSSFKENNDIIKILNANGKMTLKEIESALKNENIIQELLSLEINKRIVRLPGNYFTLSPS